MKIFANGKSLTQIGVTQNEAGRYYWSPTLGKYYTPVLKDFDTAKLPAGYKTYTNGSHTEYLYQNAIDFAIGQDAKITADKPFTVIQSSFSDGSFIKGVIDGITVYLVHTYMFAKANTTVAAGNQICKVAPQSVSGVPPHLHIFQSGGKIRTKLLAGENMVTIPARPISDDGHEMLLKYYPDVPKVLENNKTKEYIWYCEHETRVAKTTKAIDEKRVYYSTMWNKCKEQYQELKAAMQKDIDNLKAELSNCGEEKLTCTEALMKKSKEVDVLQESNDELAKALKECEDGGGGDCNVKLMKCEKDRSALQGSLDSYKKNCKSNVIADGLNLNEAVSAFLNGLSRNKVEDK